MSADGGGRAAPGPTGAAVSATSRALAALALWSTFALLGARLSHVPPLWLVGCSLALGGLVGARAWVRESGGLGAALRLRAMRPGVLLLGVYGLFTYHLCLFLALRWAPPVEANLLNYLWPLLIVLLSPIVLPGTRLALRHVLGALCGFAGAVLLVSRALCPPAGPCGDLMFDVDGLPARLGGDALAVAAAVIWATYSLLTRRVARFPTSAVAVFCLVSGALAFAAHAALEPPFVPALADVPALLLIGVGPMGAAFYLWDGALKDGDPRVLGTLAFLTPVASTALLAAFGGGTLDGRALGAMALIVGGAVVGSSPRA